MSGERAPRPSSAPQWGNCSGSVMANLSAPNLDNSASREGTAAHWVVSECLTEWKAHSEWAANLFCSDWLGETAPNGVVIDEKMANGAQIMVDNVIETCQKHGGLSKLLIEHKVHAPQIHPDNWGTLDVALPLLDKGVIYLWDYKHGHRETRAEGNLQLINYAAGLIADQNTTVVLRIVQPYCYKATGAVDSWGCKLSDLRPYINQLTAKAHEAMTAPTMSAGSWCRDCNARGVCATARRSTYSLIDYSNSPYEIDAMSGADLAVERQLLAEGLSVAKARLAAIEDDLASRITNGATDTGLALQTKPGPPKWSVPTEQAIAFAGQFGVDAAKPGVLTPTQMKSAAPKEMRAAIGQALEHVTQRAPGSLKLVNADDTVGARAFGGKPCE